MFKLYIDHIKTKLAQKKEPILFDTEKIVEEVWSADFSNPQQCRFHEETEEDYTVSLLSGEKKALLLKTLRKNVYAWTVNKIYRYKDMLIEADICFPAVKTPHELSSSGSTAHGTAAAGILFRYVSQNTFYALFVSDSGQVKLEVMVNGTAIPLFDWIQVPQLQNVQHYAVTLIANGTVLTVKINGHWVACCEDDTIQAAGNVAFALQNWNSRTNTMAHLCSFRLNSTPFMIETAHTEANAPHHINANARMQLAKVWFAMGKYIPALLQIKAVRKLRKPCTEDRLLAGRIYYAEHFFSEAEAEFKAVIDANAADICLADSSEAVSAVYTRFADSPYITAVLELGGLYYHTDQYDSLASVLESLPEAMRKQLPLLANLEGHLFHAQGLHKQAAQAYGHAFSADPSQGLFAFNQARELSLCGNTSDAVTAYQAAARLFLQNQAYDDLSAAVSALKRLAPCDEQTQVFSAKLAYALNDDKTAFAILENICQKGTDDSECWYLYGVLLLPRSVENAVHALQKAVTYEAGCGLYHFKYAETLYLHNQPYQAALQKALQCDGENGRVHNLHALAALREGDIERASEAINVARKCLPESIAVLKNYLEIERLCGRLTDCIPLFEIGEDTVDRAVEQNRVEGYRILANALHADGRFEEAQTWYTRAVKSDPTHAALLTDKAENDNALCLLNEADDTLVKALDIAPSARIYRLIASVSVQKGDYMRAEVTLCEGLRLFKTDADLWYALICLYYTTSRFDAAKQYLPALQQCERSKRVAALEAALVHGA